MCQWTNQEHYSDPTAGEAIDRILYPEPALDDAFDEQGCRRLIETIVLQAMKEYYDELCVSDRDGAALCRIRELEAFFLSGRFRRLTGLSGYVLVRGIRKEAKKNDCP